MDLGRISEVVSSGGQEEKTMVKEKALQQLKLMHIGLRESQLLFECCSHPVKRISSRKKGTAGTLSQQAQYMEREGWQSRSESWSPLPRTVGRAVGRIYFLATIRQRSLFYLDCKGI